MQYKCSLYHQYKRCHSIMWSAISTAASSERRRERGGDGAAAPRGDNDLLFYIVKIYVYF